MKSSPPMLMAMIMFRFSEAEEMKITGIWEVFRISWHQ